MGVPQMVDELDLRLEQWPGQPGAVVASEHPVLAAVVHAEVHLERGLGREHLFAQHTPVEILRVRLHQVFLHVLRGGERRGTLLARVLGGGHQEVTDDVLLVVFEMHERQVAVRARQLDFAVEAGHVRGRSRGRLQLLLLLVLLVLLVFAFVRVIAVTACPI